MHICAENVPAILLASLFLLPSSSIHPLPTLFGSNFIFNLKSMANEDEAVRAETVLRRHESSGSMAQCEFPQRSLYQIWSRTVQERHFADTYQLYKLKERIKSHACFDEISRSLPRQAAKLHVPLQSRILCNEPIKVSLSNFGTILVCCNETV